MRGWDSGGVYPTSPPGGTRESLEPKQEAPEVGGAGAARGKVGWAAKAPPRDPSSASLSSGHSLPCHPAAVGAAQESVCVWVCTSEAGPQACRARPVLVHMHGGLEHKLPVVRIPVQPLNAASV